MKASDFRAASVEDLAKEAYALGKELFNLRMQKGDEFLKTHRFKQVRRSIAKIKTILRERGV